MLGDAARLPDDVAEALVTVGQRVFALKLHLALHGDVLLLDIVRAATDIHLVVGLQGERCLSLWDTTL